MHIGMEYEGDNWNKLKQIAREVYGISAVNAVRRLIDHAIRTRAIPGIQPLLSAPVTIGETLIMSGDYKAGKWDGIERRGMGVTK